MNNIHTNKVILHDAVITNCTLCDNDLKLDFAGGFQLIPNINGTEQWASSGSIIYEQIDPEFCCFRIMGTKKFKEFSIRKLPEIIKKKKNKRFEIIDEYYGYSTVMLCGYFWRKHKHKRFQIELYYRDFITYEINK